MTSGPVYFGAEDRPIFGWLHLPNEASRGADALAVVLCNPFGYESMCTNRSLRHFAEAFARAGVPSLRFDYDGTGDSAGSDFDPDRVRAWLGSVHSAIDFIEARTGARRVCLFGLRLGATLAAAAAAERSDAVGLVAAVPIVSPERYVRELVAFHSWSRLPTAPDGRSGLAEDDLEASGFVITAATESALRRLDLVRQESAPAPRVLVLEDVRRPHGDRWAGRLDALGVEVDKRRVAGFAEMSRDPHKTAIPHPMIAESAQWVAELARDARTIGAGPERRSKPIGPRTSVSIRTGRAGSVVVESAVRIARGRDGDASWLFGILSRPDGLPTSERTIILLNAGAQHRIGPNRLWVTLARRWAEVGVMVLRLDLSGLGDSPARRGEEENAVYNDVGWRDIEDAASYLRREVGARRIDVVGFCGSAYHAFKAATRGVPVDGVVLVNPQRFFWDESEPQENEAGRAASEMRRYRRSVLSVASWKKLLSGKVDLSAAARSAKKRLGDLASNRARALAHRLNVPLRNDLARELRSAASFGVPMHFVFSDEESGELFLRERGGSVVDGLVQRGLVSIEHTESADHTYTAFWMHRVLTEVLERRLGLPSRAADPLPERRAVGGGHRAP